MPYWKDVKENSIEINLLNSAGLAVNDVYAAVPTMLSIKEDENGIKNAYCTQWTVCSSEQEFEKLNEDLVRYFSIEDWKGFDNISDAMYLSKNLIKAFHKALEFTDSDYILHALLIRPSKDRSKNERVIVPISESNIINYVKENLWDIYSFNAKRVESVYSSDLEFVNPKKADFSFYPTVDYADKSSNKDEFIFFDVPGTSMHMKAPVSFFNKMKELYSMWKFFPKRFTI